jgi:pheromone shutdown protein TraB
VTQQAISSRGTGRGLQARALLGLGVAAVSILVWFILAFSGMTAVMASLAAGILAGLTAALASRPVAAVTPGELPIMAPPIVAPAIEPETLRQLRHDLRGILSPALMTADRLLMTTEDPIARRAAEAMVETIERAEKRLAD